MNKPFYIDYPQENFEGQATRYRCAFCKVETTEINGNLAGHLRGCEYRQKIEDQHASLAAGLLDSEDVG